MRHTWIRVTPREHDKLVCDHCGAIVWRTRPFGKLTPKHFYAAAGQSMWTTERPDCVAKRQLSGQGSQAPRKESEGM